jgi:hypothetical protein
LQSNSKASGEKATKSKAAPLIPVILGPFVQADELDLAAEYALSAYSISWINGKWITRVNMLTHNS